MSDQCQQERRAYQHVSAPTSNRRSFLIGAGAAGLAAANLSATHAAAAVQQDTTLTIGFNLDPETLNPLLTTAIASESVIAAAVEKLAIFEAESMKPVPWLADSWEYTNPTTFQIKIKPGIKFSNGEPLDGVAAKFSIEEWARQPVMAQSAAALEGMEVTAVDATTVTITTPKPVPTIPSILGRYFYMVPPKYYQKVGQDGFAKAPIGTGPFVLAKHDAAQQIVFTRNPTWWKGPHPIGTVIFRVMPEELSRTVALERGEIDIAYYLSASMAARLKNVSGAKVYSVAGLRKFISAFNAEMPGGEPLNNPAVAIALNQAIDLDGLISAVFENKATKMQGQFALPVEFGFDKQLSAYSYDPDGARKAIAAAGYPNGFKITYAYTVGRYPKDKEIGEIITTYLQAVGIQVEQKPLEWGEFNQQRKDQTLGHIFQFGILLVPDLADTFDYMAYGKEARGAPMMTWSDQWWALYKQSNTEVDEQKRADLYHQMLQIDHDKPYGIYLFAPNDFYAARDRVVGYVPRKDQALYVYDLSLK